MLLPEYRCVRLDGRESNRADAIQELESLFLSTHEPITLRERLIAVSVCDETMVVRAVKELAVGAEEPFAEDVEETWRLNNGRWRLAETRVSGG